MIRAIRKPGDPPLPPIEVDFGTGEFVIVPTESWSQSEFMSEKSFLPSKPVEFPLSGENLVSYGDRLLWHQLGLQLNGRENEMLSEDEYVTTVLGFYADALEHNVRAYRSYFNSRQATMGFREIEMPIPVEFAEGHDVAS